MIAKYFPVKKITLLRNFPIASSFLQEKNYASRQNQLVYVGLLSKPRGVVEMLEAHRKVSEKTNLDFVLGGKFAPASLEHELLSIFKVQFKSWLPYDEMIKALYEARIGIIIPHPIERWLARQSTVTFMARELAVGFFLEFPSASPRTVGLRWTVARA